MKTKTLLFLFLLISGIMSAQVKRVAILETVDRENKVSYGNKLILRANLSKAITNTAGYEAYDRTDIDAIMGEQNFQRTGLVSNDQIKKLGEMTGANYILVAEAAVVDANNMFITAKLLDVETARTIMTDNVMMAANPEAIQEGCVTLAKKLFHGDEMTQNNTTTTTFNRTNQTSVNEPANQITPQAIYSIVDNYELLVRNSKKNQKQHGIKEYSYGDTQMDTKALMLFLKKHNATAYNRFAISQPLIKSGWWTFGCGLGAMGVGIAAGSFTSGTSATFLSLGSLSTAASIPLLICGYSFRNNAIATFNRENVNQPALSLNLHTSQNGVGLALSF